ncbi:hypothetical protein HY643_03170 [Candidatus Woesearchaeota archaeon]|nr:hypothetical protein [Candidatus Woesearchaeota archaeon]
MVRGEEIGQYGRTDIRKYVAGGGATARSIFGRVLFVILIIVLLTFAYFGYVWVTSTEGERTLTDVKNWFSENNPVTWYQRNILQRATNIGNIWVAEPNKTAEEKGVLFNDFFVVGDKELPLGQKLVLAYDLSISNAEVANLPLYLGCKMLKEEIEAEILPENPVKISGMAVPDITCVFDTKQINLTNAREPREIEGQVTFPFKTEDATLKVYFVSEKTSQELKGKDFFSTYNLDINQPIRVVYNGEPLEVGIGANRKDVQPVVVGGKQTILGLRLRNAWKGKVEKITEITLWLPKEVTINNALSQNPSNLCPFVNQGLDGETNKYVLADEYKEKIAFGQRIKEQEKTAQLPSEEKTFECWLDVSDDILSGALYSVKEYKATVGYIYEMPKKTATVTLLKVE